MRHYRASYHASTCENGANDDDCGLEPADNKSELVLVLFLELSRPSHTLSGCLSEDFVDAS